MSKSPVVQRMVMFKHGVAYLERGGPADGSFELSFKRDEMNDVLKSLAVWVARGDAKIGAVAFEKPEDPEAALAARRLNLTPGAALLGLLAALRGRKVAVDAGGVRQEGEVLGVDTSSGGDGMERRALVLRLAEGRVSLVDLGAAKTVDLLEAPSRADVAFLVDRSRAATSGESRTVQVAVTGTAEDLRVSYVIPAPTWRVSYRLARGGADTTVMAWGIVHNPADEDLDEIDLTLTTGQPVSFVIDLYNPKSVARVKVEEKSRALAAPPTSFERAPGMPPPAPGAPAPRGMPAPAMAMAPQRMAGPSREIPTGQLAGASFGAALDELGEDAAKYADRGELFEYRVASKISLKRGGSAMVPLLASKLDARKERIWRDGSPFNPDLVLTFKNSTGAVLEEGPAVVYDESVYAGESMVPYSARGTEVKLAFAKDLGVRCSRTGVNRSSTSGIRLGDQVLIEDQRCEEQIELRAESDHAEPVDVIFELPKVARRTLDPGKAQPFEETMSYWRFKLTVPPRSKATLALSQQWAIAQHIQYHNIQARNLAQWLEGRFLDQKTFDALAEVLAAWNEGATLDAERGQVEREQQAAYAKQQKISEQLAVLKEGGAEGDLRLRYVRELEAEQDKVNGCEAKVRSLYERAEAARRRAGERLLQVTHPRH